MKRDLKRKHMEEAANHYSSLFTLPSYKNINMFLFIQCIIIGLVAVLPFYPSTFSLYTGLWLGFLLFLSTFVGNFLTAKVFLKKDLILDLRRCSFLSLISNLIFFAFVFLGYPISDIWSNQNLWFKVTSVGLFTSLTLRFLVFFFISFKGMLRIIISAIFQPAMYLLPFLIILFPFWLFEGNSLFFFTLATFLAFFGVRFFIFYLNGISKKLVGFPSNLMFRAFLANWTENLEKPLEEVLEKLSEEREARVSIIAFKAKDIKAVIVVPTIHPGPFKNVGSSAIPSMIQKALEKKLGCVVSVPHGISGHEFDLVSQAQNQKILKQILKLTEFDDFNSNATQFQSIKIKDATAGCQIFGDCALLTLTLAPKTMEDLPLELNEIIIQEAKNKGLSCVISIDAHNSIQGHFNLENALDPIKKAAISVIGKTLQLEQQIFKVGASKITPEDFSIKEGMGPGGISVILIEAGNHKTAYITIDGNNMVSGLREKIISCFKELDINGGEILTTDTHIVNAVTKADRGYHPIGEIIDQNKIIEYIKTALIEAEENLEPAKASWFQKKVKGLKIIGEKRINELSLLVSKVAEKAKSSSATIFTSFGILLIILLLFL